MNQRELATSVTQPYDEVPLAKGCQLSRSLLRLFPVLGGRFSQQDSIQCVRRTQLSEDDVGDVCGPCAGTPSTRHKVPYLAPLLRHRHQLHVN